MSTKVNVQKARSLSNEFKYIDIKTKTYTVKKGDTVITSYSIHYTKLYDLESEYLQTSP